MKQKLQKMLEQSIDCFGITDEITIKISQKLDEEIIKLQKEKYNSWKSGCKQEMAV